MFGGFPAFQFLLEGIAALPHAILTDEARAVFVPAQMADIRHFIGGCHRLDEPHAIAMGTRKRVHFPRSRGWTRDDRVSLSLSHSLWKIVASAVEV